MHNLTVVNFDFLSFLVVDGDVTHLLADKAGCLLIEQQLLDLLIELFHLASLTQQRKQGQIKSEDHIYMLQLRLFLVQLGGGGGLPTFKLTS